MVCYKLEKNHSLAGEEVSDNKQCEYIDESRKGKKPVFDNSNNDIGCLTKTKLQYMYQIFLFFIITLFYYAYIHLLINK